MIAKILRIANQANLATAKSFSEPIMERRAWCVRFDQTKPKWCVLDTDTQRFVISNEPLALCREVRDAINNAKDAKPKARKIASAWKMRLKMEKLDEK